MIGAVSGVPVFLATGVTDMRRGIGGLCAQARNVLQENPAGGAVFVFRGRKGDRLKILHWDGQGFCLYYKVLERGYFPWPQASGGAVSLTPAQLSMLWEGSNRPVPLTVTHKLTAYSDPKLHSRSQGRRGERNHAKGRLFLVADRGDGRGSRRALRRP